MSTHPNTILMAEITPNGLSRKTLRGIRDAYQDNYGDVKLGARSYSLFVMEEEEGYDGEKQISAKEGSIVAHTYLTYGYGEVVTWDEVVSAKEELDAWLKKVADAFDCSYEIKLTANYW